MYQAPDRVQNWAKFRGLLILRYFLGRLVPGLKKTIAFFKSIGIFTIFEMNASDCGKFRGRLSGPVEFYSRPFFLLKTAGHPPALRYPQAPG